MGVLSHDIAERRHAAIAWALWLFAPCALVACAMQAPLAQRVVAWESDPSTIPANAVMIADPASEYAFFGDAVAISGDTAVIGAWGDADAGRNTGAAYVFARDGDVWAQVARLTAVDAAPGARFGHSVAIDGGVILIGAIYHDANGFRSGAVYVFERVDDSWRQIALLTPMDASQDAHFGSSLALDGRTALIGAAGPGAGAAYVFESDGRDWAERARLAPTGLAMGQRFGKSVALDDAVAVVGAPSTSVDAEDAPASAVHVFERSNGSWQHLGVLNAEGAGAVGAFGTSVAVDRDTIAVGSPGSIGAVFVYHRSERGWALHSEIVATEGDALHFGTSIAIEDGMLVVGSPGTDERAGAAYLFEYRDAGWTGAGRIVSPNPERDQHAGGAVAIDRGVVLVGATGVRTAGPATGATYAAH